MYFHLSSVFFKGLHTITIVIYIIFFHVIVRFLCISARVFTFYYIAFGVAMLLISI